MKISLRNSILFIMVISVSFLYSAEQKDCIKEKLLAKLSPEIVNDSLFMKEYKQMNDNFEAVRSEKDQIGKVDYIYNELSLDKLEYINSELLHNVVKVRVYKAISNNGKSWMTAKKFRDDYSLYHSVITIYSANNPNEIIKLGSANRLLPEAISNDRTKIFLYNDEDEELVMLELNVETAENKTKVVKKIPRLISLGYLDSFQQLCVFTKNENNQEEISFIKLSDFEKSSINESDNLLKN